jgi:phosphopantetheinyl transferase (holo-ACP synthase)
MRHLARRHPKRLNRIFTHRELRWANQVKDKSRRLACLFASKEAVFKSLGLNPVMFFQWTSIDISPLGSVHQVNLKGNLSNLLQKKNNTLSVVWRVIKKYAVAIATKRSNALVSN